MFISDFFSKHIAPQSLIVVLYRMIAIVFVIVISRIIINRGFVLIDQMLMKEEKYLKKRKRKTLKILLKRIFRFTIYFISIIIILDLFEVPVTSLLAGAGIIGVAVGFGAQNMVRDIINGFFILFEDQFGVDDYIKTAEVEGIVQEIGLRITTIRDFNGELHIIPNGQINKVTNYCAGDIRILVDVSIGYEENIENTINVLEEMCNNIDPEKQKVITVGPQVMGVQDLADSAVIIRLMVRTKPMEQWQMARYLRKKIKETLNQSNIEIAYPQLCISEKKDRGVIYGEEE